MELNKKGLYARVPKCQITLYYYVGFCYLMMRRYQVGPRVVLRLRLSMGAGCRADLGRYSRLHPAHAAVPHALLWIRLPPQEEGKRACTSYAAALPTALQLLNLLAIAIVLAPQRIDESVQLLLNDKLADKLGKLQRGFGRRANTALFARATDESGICPTALTTNTGYLNFY